MTLVATCWTTAGAVAARDIDAASPEDLRRRIEVAAAAGFTGIGVHHVDLCAARAGYGDRAIRMMLEDNGIEHLELEVLTGWFSTGPRRADSDERRHALLDAAEALDANLIKVIGEVGGAVVDPDVVAGELAVLADQAAAAGAMVGIESVPVCDLSTPAKVLDVLERIDHPAAGLVLDNWQIHRAGVEVAALRSSITARRIATVELSDGPWQAQPDFVVDCFDHRGPPGSGELDVAGFVAAVVATGYTGPWGVEILHTDHRRRRIEEAVPAAYTALAAHCLPSRR